VSSEDELMMLIRAAKEHQAAAKEERELAQAIMAKANEAVTKLEKSISDLANTQHKVDGGLQGAVQVISNETAAHLSSVAKKGITDGLKDTSRELRSIIKDIRSALAFKENWLLVTALGIAICFGLAIGVSLGAALLGMFTKNDVSTVTAQLDTQQEQINKIMKRLKIKVDGK
jgi:hypothetical protein